MEIVFEQYKAKKHSDYFWELFEHKAVVPRGRHHDPDAEPVEKWCSLGRYPSTMALAMEDIYELAVKNSPGVYDLKDALAAAKRIERSIERAAKAALAKEEQ